MSDISLSKAVRANLLSLQNTAEMMNKTQSRLATGNKVNSALDNPSNFFTAAALNSRAADMSNLLDSMASGIKVIEAANNGITALTKNLESMQSTLRQARQDKSFQTQSFEVTDKSVINFGGGRFDLDTVVKLSDAEAKQGVNASLSSIGTTAYVGPVSTEASAAGAGARTVISGLGGIPANSSITVAGVDVNVGAYADATELATTIQTALDADNDVAGQYRVMAGEAGSPNAGKIIIETVNTGAPAAEVAFGAGTTEAVKGSVTFNFADLPNEITVGTQTIPTGTDIDSFVASLTAGEKAGQYDVTVDADDNITLTAKEFGAAAPSVTGVPPGSPPTAATTTFSVNLASNNAVSVAGQTIPMGGTLSTATYQISLTGTNPSTINVAGADVTIPAATGTTPEAVTAAATAAAGAINTALADANIAYTATVSNTGELRLTSNAVDGSTPPQVTSGTTSSTPQTVAAGTVNAGNAARATTATFEVSFGADPSTIKVGNANIIVPPAGATAAADLEALIGQALTDQSLDFAVDVATTGTVTFTANTAGNIPAPTLTTGDAIVGATVTAGTTSTGSLGTAASASWTVNLTQATAQEISVNGKAVTIPAGATAADKITDLTAAINEALDGTNFEVGTIDDSTGAVTLTSIDNDGVAPSATLITTGTAVVGTTIAGTTGSAAGSIGPDNAQVVAAQLTAGTAVTSLSVAGTEIDVPVWSTDATELAAQGDAFEASVEAALAAASKDYGVSFDTATLSLVLTANNPGLDSTPPAIASGTGRTAQTVAASANAAPGTAAAQSEAEFTLDFTGTAPFTVKVGTENVVIDPTGTNSDIEDALDAALGATFTSTVNKTTGEVTLTAVANGPTTLPAFGNGDDYDAQTVAAGSSENGAAAASTTATYQIAVGGTAPTTITVGAEEVIIPAGATGTDAGGLISASLTNQGLAFGANVSATGLVTLTAANPGNIPAPTITSGTTNISAQTVATGNVTTGSATAAETPGSLTTKIETALTAAGMTGFEVAVNADGDVSITDTTAGARAAVQVTGAGATNVQAEAGTATTSGAVESPTVVGVSSETVDAAQDTFTVSYDGKQAEVSITGLKLGAGALDRVNWQADTVASVNAQLEGKGIKGVEAKFDDAGKLELVSKEKEAKTLAISGKDATRLFGDETVSIGSPTETGLNATKTTDKFVEFINKKFGGEVRASNDNGKLRIENLSTQALDIGVDTNGNGAINSLKVEGNTVRANLSKQFNELRDQLDKLSDDASFNGINLLRGDKLKITFNESGTSSIDIQGKDKDGNVRGINASNLNIDTLVAENLDTDEAIDAYLSKLSSALTELRTQASSFGSNLSSVENRQSFTKNMINTLETGAANLTLADTNEEAANLLALQTRQQLSSSALSMASQQDQAVLQLLR